MDHIEVLLNSFRLSKDIYSLFENLKGVLFFIKDKDSNLIGGNKLFAEHCGLEHPDELIGKNDFEIFPIELAQHFRKDDLNVIKTGKAKLNIIELFPNYLGDLEWFITNKVPIINEQKEVCALCGIAQQYQDSANYYRPLGEISNALDFIKNNYMSQLSNKELAQKSALSVRQFERRFKDLFKTTPQKYIIKLRILKGCELLLSEDMTIVEIALKLGFYDQSAFTSHFKKHTGYTPLQYIKKHVS